MLKDHKKKSIEEKVNLEIAQQRSRQMQLAKDQQNERILRKIESDNMRVLALEKYKLSLVEDKARFKEKIVRSKDRGEFLVEKSITTSAINQSFGAPKRPTRLLPRSGVSLTTHRASSVNQTNSLGRNRNEDYQINSRLRRVERKRKHLPFYFRFLF